MNSNSDLEEFDVTHKKNHVLISDVKTELQDVKSEQTIEAVYIKHEMEEDHDPFTSIKTISEDVKSEPMPEAIYITHKIKEDHDPFTSIKTISEVYDTQGSFNNWLEDDKIKSRGKPNNTVTDKINTVPIVLPRETCVPELQEVESGKCVSDVIGENRCTNNIYNSVFQQSDSNMCLGTSCNHVEFNNSDRNYTVNKVINTSTFACVICDKSFSDKFTFIKHYNTHSNDKSDRGNMVTKFIDTSHLNTCIHNNEKLKTKKCNFCRKSFASKSGLNIHKRIHTNEKPFKCDFCSMSFTQISNLNTHRRTHTNEKPFKCDFCNKLFTYKCYLSKHIRIHTNEKPFKCNFCNKLFSQLSHLNTHTRTHTNIKPFKCDFCSKSFTQKSNINTHTRTHTNEKPFKCDFCSKSFTHKCSLKYHIRTHLN